MNMRKALLGIVFLPLTLYAQVLDNTSQQYAMRYVKEHWFLQKGDDLNVIDTDIEWPEALNYQQPKPLQSYISECLFGENTVNFDSAYHAFTAKHGQPVTKQFEKLPDDRRYCYITASARVKDLNPDKWICYAVSYEAKPERLSPVKARKDERYVLYDFGRQQVMTADMIVRQNMIQDGYVEQDFFDTILAPLDEHDYGEIKSVSIDGAWFEEKGRTLGLHITCKTDQTLLGYDIYMPYESVRYLITKNARKLVEKTASKPKPEYIVPPATWKGDSVYKTVDTMPVFRGGSEGLKTYLTNIIPPTKSKAGKVIASFVIDKEGWAKDIRVVGPLTPDVDRHAVNLVRGMPKFTPGKLHGQPACVRMYVPIQYR
jgi:hypothetical protein